MRIRLKYERLQRALACRHRSQNAWALALGLDSGHLSKLLSGKRPYPSAETRKKLLVGTGLAFEELFEIEIAPSRRPVTGARPRGTTRKRRDVRMRLWNDVRYTFRLMGRSPGFTVLALLVIALGVGATSAVLGVAGAVFLDSLPFAEPDRLVVAHSLDRGSGTEGPFSVPDFRDLRDENRMLEGMAAFGEESYIVGRVDGSERVIGELVSPDYFRLLGVEPELGRAFSPEEDRAPLAEPVVLLGHDLFSSRFGSDAALVGTSIEVNDAAFTVVGVLPAGFRGFSGHAELFVPLAAFDALHPELVPYEILDARGTRWHSVLARLAPGRSLDEANANLDTLAASLAASHPETNADRSVVLKPARDEVVESFESSAYLLAGAVGLLLMLSCANLANLFLGKALSRDGEMAVRVAMGASRGRLVRQMLTESVVFAVAGGALGILVAHLGLAALTSLAPVELPRYLVPALDARLAATTLVLSTVTGCLFGIAPAFAAPVDSLKRTARSGFGRHPLQTSLVLGEIAISVVLLVSAGLIGKSFYRMRQFEPGFETEKLLTLRFHLPSSASPSETLDRLRERLRALPGVEEAAIGSHVYFGGGYMSGPLTVEDAPSRSSTEALRAYRQYVSPGYFETMGITLLRGRAFDANDVAGRPRVVVVNRSFAEKTWPGRDPLGKRVATTDEPTADDDWLTVVGIVADVKPRLRVEPSGGWPQLYSPLRQGGEWSRCLFLRTSMAPRAVLPEVSEAIREMDPGIALFSVASMEELLVNSRASARFVTVLMTAFAASALLLAGVGLYGVVSLGVNLRMHELGVRLALGASRGSLLTMVLRHAVLLAAGGLLLGIAGALLFSRALGALLFEVTPLERGVYLAVALAVVVVVLAASFVPATRAASASPLRVLRHE